MNQRSITTSNGNNEIRSDAQTNLQQDLNKKDINSINNIDQQASIINDAKNAEYNEDFDKNLSHTKVQATHHQHHNNHHNQHSISPPPCSPVSLSDRNNTSASPHWPMENPTDRTNSKRKTKSDDNESSSNRPQAAFVNKLYKMLEDESIQHLINWSEKGDLFSVGNPTSFSKLVLPQYFKHNNWQSFVRQLNMYGFHKVNDMIHSNLTSENQKWEFKHQNFRRGAVDELQNIKRKSAKSHHQYLSPSIAGSSLSTSSMGRLLLGGYPQQKASGDDSYRRNDKLIMIKSSNSRTNNDGDTNNSSTSSDKRWIKSSSAQGYQSDPLYQHVLQMEDRIHQISQSHDNLKNETDELRAMLTSRNLAMEEITNLLLALTKEDGRIANSETAAIINKSVIGLRETLMNDMHLKKRPSAISIVSSRSSSTSPYMSNSDNDNNNSDSRRSSIIRYSNTYNHYNDSTSNSRNTHCANDMAPTCRNNDERLEGIPISSILSSIPPRQHHPYDEPETTRNQRLPSIDIVCTKPPSPHHSNQEHQPSTHSFSSPSISPVTTTSLSPSSKSLSITSTLDLDRPIPPLRPLRSLLESSDQRHPRSDSQIGPRSAYMRLGKESPLLNPPIRLEPPPYDYSGSSETKRRRPDHDYTHVP